MELDQYKNSSFHKMIISKFGEHIYASINEDASMIWYIKITPNIIKSFLTIYKNDNIYCINGINYSETEFYRALELLTFD